MNYGSNQYEGASGRRGEKVRFVFRPFTHSPTRPFTIIIHLTIIWKLITCIIIGFSIRALSQEAQFSQYYSFPLYLNPAFTGVVPHDRTSFIYRKQWLGIPGAYETYGFSYDHNWTKKKSGLGMVVVQDKTSNGGFSTLTAGGLYSYHMQLGRIKYVSAGMRVSYFQQTLDQNKLMFGDQLIRNDGSPTVEIFENQQHGFADISWGTLFTSIDSVIDHGYWAGITLDHLNAPPVTFLEAKKGYQPFKLSVHGGIKYVLSKDLKAKPTSRISFNFLYKAQRKWDQLEEGVFYEYHGFMAGFSYRGIPLFKRYKPGYPNHEALIITGVFSNDHLQIGYNFDLTISKLGISNSKGSHEVTITSKFKIPQSEKSKYRKKFIIATPKF